MGLDADAVFVPWRLQKALSTQPVSWTGVYIENCADVQYGFFGSVEVISHQAFSTLVSSIGECSCNQVVIHACNCLGTDWRRSLRSEMHGQEGCGQDPEVRSDHRWGLPSREESLGQKS